MRQAAVTVCLTSVVLLCLVGGVIGQATKGLKLESVKVERVDADHFRAVVEFVNGTNSDVYLQSAIDRSSGPYPLYLERRVSGDEWQTVAPCVDVMPSSAISVPPRKSIKVDEVYPLELPSTCRIRRIDTSGEYRWRIEYFRNKRDLLMYEKSRGRSGRAVNIVSKPFVITP